MTFKIRSIDDMVLIAAAGGGFALDAGGMATVDLIRIAAAAAGRDHRTRIELHSMSGRPTDDLIRIGAAGQGSVIFMD